MMLPRIALQDGLARAPGWHEDHAPGGMTGRADRPREILCASLALALIIIAPSLYATGPGRDGPIPEGSRRVRRQQLPGSA